MKAAVVDTGRSGRLRAGLKAPRAPDCPDQLQLYLNHLTALVPTAPKHRRLSKLEVIQCVIDYICDLEDTLLGRHQLADEPTEPERPALVPEQQMEPAAGETDTPRASQPPPPPAAGS